MSDGEQPAAEVVAVEEAVEEEQPAAEEQPALQLPKERVRKPSRPDDTELKAQTEVLNAQIQKAKARIAQIGETIEARWVPGAGRWGPDRGGALGAAAHYAPACLGETGL